MSNLEISKNWEDNNLLELSINAKSKFVTIHQLCYVQDTDLKEIGEKIIAYSFDAKEEIYVEFDEKEGNLHQHFL